MLFYSLTTVLHVSITVCVLFLMKLIGSQQYWSCVTELKIQDCGLVKFWYLYDRASLIQ